MTVWGLRKEGGISLETPQFKRASSCVDGRISLFFSSCGRVLLEFRQGPQGPVLGASGRSSHYANREGPLSIPLQLLPCLWSSSGVEAGISGFLCRADMGLRFPLGPPEWSQASSHVEPCKSTLLSSRRSSVSLPGGLTIGINDFLSRCHPAVTPAIVI